MVGLLIVAAPCLSIFLTWPRCQAAVLDQEFFECTEYIYSMALCSIAFTVAYTACENIVSNFRISD